MLVRRAVLPSLALALSASVLAAPPVVDEHIKVDQFGYPPGATKIAVISDPQVGYNAPDPFTPASTYEVRRYADDTTAWSGPVVAWGGGAQHVQSGDRAWRVDFTALTEEGSFYLWDAANAVGSFRFEIRPDVYAPVLEAAVRALYYQRCGTPKLAAHAGADWADGAACHVGAEQDVDCRWVLDTSPATSRDLSGGWHDAGDYNKYVNFSDGPLHDLLFAYQNRPSAFADDYGIPESGNGVPDVLDEARVELDWMLRMQEADGSLLHKVSVTNFNAASPPSADAEPRRYAQATASATISGAGTFAHGAVVFGSLPATQAYGATLEAAALSAWGWLEANPGSIPSSYDNQGFQNVAAEDSPEEQAANMVCAAIYLYRLTGQARFRTYVDANYQNVHLVQWGFAYPFEGYIQDGMLSYGDASGATASVVAAIESAYVGSMQNDHLSFHAADEDAYLAWFPDNWYVWGSLDFKATEANMFSNVLVHDLDPGNAVAYQRAAEAYVHGMHGVNPLAWTYLSNMGSLGAENSINEIYHSWFGDGTPWDNAQTSTYGPAPGFVPGGPNPTYVPDPTYPGTIEPPQNQPIQKSYNDWNTSWPQNSWEVTEVSIYAQAAYIRMLSWLTSLPSGSGSTGNYLAGAGPGAQNPNEVRIFDANGGPTSTDFLAYSAGAWGVNVAAGELDGDATGEIGTGPGPGAVFGPQVRAFQETGSAMGKVNFFAYGTLKYGVNVALESVDGDPADEILTGAGPGEVFGPHVRGFDLGSGSVTPIAKINFFAYQTLKYGVNVQGGDLDSDGFAEILTGPGPGTIFGPQVRGFNVDGGQVSAMAKVNFNAFALSGYGANVAGGDVDGDAFAEIVAGPGPGPSHPASVGGFDFDGASVAAIPGFPVQPFTTTYGSRVGTAEVGGATVDQDVLAGPGADPAALSSVRAYEVAGTSSMLPVAFDAFPGTTFGVNVAGGPFGF